MKKNFVSFICSLHGYLIRIKEIHWNTDNNAEHLLCADISDDLADCEDRFAECAMGMAGEHFKIGALKPMLPHSTSLIPMLKELETEILELKDSLTSIKDDGLMNILDEMLENCGKYKNRASQK